MLKTHRQVTYLTNSKNLPMGDGRDGRPTCNRVHVHFGFRGYGDSHGDSNGNSCGYGMGMGIEMPSPRQPWVSVNGASPTDTVQGSKTQFTLCCRTFTYCSSLKQS